MLGAAKEIALFIARDRPRGGDAVQRRDHLCDIILDQPLGAEARLLIQTLVAHAVDIAVDALVEDEEQPLRIARRRQGAQPVEPGAARAIVEMLAFVGAAPRLTYRFGPTHPTRLRPAET